MNQKAKMESGTVANLNINPSANPLSGDALSSLIEGFNETVRIKDEHLYSISEFSKLEELDIVREFWAVTQKELLAKNLSSFESRLAEALSVKLYNDDLQAIKKSFLNTTFHSRDIPEDIFKDPLEDVKIANGRLILDLNESDTVDLMEEFVKTRDLMAFDSNKDGIIDAQDKLFEKLKIVMNDGTITHLSSVTNYIDISSYLNDKKSEAEYLYDTGGEIAFWSKATSSKDKFMQEIDPIYTHIDFDKRDLEGMVKDESGWILRDLNNESFLLH